MTSVRVPLSVVVLTFNEERNLEACLGAVSGWASDIFVVDSGSTDRTREIAATYGAHVVHHAFETHARQWGWALRELPIVTDWVLAIDADQQVSGELRRSIAVAVSAASSPPVAGYYLNRRQIFRGVWIRHGGYYPKYLLKMFRRDAVRVDREDLVDHHFEVTGPTSKLAGDLIEDNRNEIAIADWVAKHNRYARLQATQEIRERRQPPSARPFESASPDATVRRQKRLWRRMPLFVRPFLYFVYRYVLRLGFLDGREGFIFHFMQAFWYRLMVDVNIIEATRDAAVPAAVPPTRVTTDRALPPVGAARE